MEDPCSGCRSSRALLTWDPVALDESTGTVCYVPHIPNCNHGIHSPPLLYTGILYSRSKLWPQVFSAPFKTEPQPAKCADFQTALLLSSLSQWENVKLFWVPSLVPMKRLELVTPWWLENSLSCQFTQAVKPHPRAALIPEPWHYSQNQER